MAILIISGLELSAEDKTPLEKYEERQAEKNRAFLNKSGLSHLSDDDKDRVAQLIKEAIYKERTKDQERESAYRYLLNNNFVSRRISMTDVNGRDAMVVDDLGSVFFTFDVPLGISRLFFTDSNYLCKTRILGGIESLIKYDGREVGFTALTQWTMIRR